MNALPGGSRRRGVVLIVVLSCLAVLAMVAVAFAVINSLDRDTASNFRLTTQARLVARAGVEHAVSRLSTSQALATALVDGGEWMYYGNDMSGSDPSKRGVSLTTAKRPSYAIMSAPGKPEQVRILHEGKKTLSVGVSGRMGGGEFLKDGNQYALEVIDLSGCIYVNDGLKMQGGNKSSVSENLRRILNALGREPKVKVGGLGDRVVDNRPHEGYASWMHFAAIMKKRAGLEDEEIRNLERFLTVHAWVDTNVVNPVPFSRAAAARYPVHYERGEEMVYRRGAGKDYKGQLRTETELGWIEDPSDRSAIAGTTAAVYGLDELFPGYVEVVHRAPVNVNTATLEVLIALLSELRGVYLQERRSNAPTDPSPPDINYQSTQWVQSPLIFSIPQNNYTWEYMGHTYSPDSWPAPRAVNENKKWSDARGATTQMPEEQQHIDVPDKDELGFLVATPALTTDGTAPGTSARAVAGEIIACRESRGDYAGLPFGGPFKTWAQFHAFCDYLAETGVLRDPRYPEGYLARQANQAFADVLKANFNPNFTPNEINPDRNLFLLVDKTDLIVNSTEFCFLPTGFFQVNSLGRILKKSDKEAADGGGILEVAAQAGAKAVVRVHELYRETSQRQFYRGDFGGVKPRSRTNNGRTLESGPEPDNGPLIYGDHFNRVKIVHSRELDNDAQYYEDRAEFPSGWGYEASGYLALPTCGGPDDFKAPYTMMPTQPAESAKDEIDADMIATPRMHAHYKYDDRLHWNQSTEVQRMGGGDPRLFIENMASVLMSGTRRLVVKKVFYNPATCSSVVLEAYVDLQVVEKASNYADPGEDSAGEEGDQTYSPYDPTDGIRYRLCRSFRLPLEGKGPTRPPTTSVAPSDLRVDGMYVERHSGLAYWVDEAGSNILPPGAVGQDQAYSFDTRHGVASFWFKPSFDPRYSGKIRTIASISRFHRANYHYRNPSPFTLYYFPSFPDSPTGDVLPRESRYDGQWPAVAAQNPPPPPGQPPSGVWDGLPIARDGRVGLASIAPASLVFNIAWSAFDGTGWDQELPDSMSPPAPLGAEGPPVAEMEHYAYTPTLSPSAGLPRELDSDFLRGHRWTHIAMIWDVLQSGAVSQPSMSISVNGHIPQGSREDGPSGTWNKWGEKDPPKRAAFAVNLLMDHIDPQDPRWFVGPEDAPNNKSIANVFRLGEVSTHSFNPFPRNYSSDGTYDEFYLFTDAANALHDAIQPQFKRGRYYLAQGGTTEEAKWSSPVLRLVASADWKLPNGSEIQPPGGGIGGGSAIKGNSTTARKQDNKPQLLGVSWTWYAERYALDGMPPVQSMFPVAVDYQQPARPAAMLLARPAVRILVTPEGNQTYPTNDDGGYDNDAFSPIRDVHGAPVRLEQDGMFKYHVRFKFESGPIAGGSPGGEPHPNPDDGQKTPTEDPKHEDPPPLPAPGVPPTPPPPPQSLESRNVAPLQDPPPGGPPPPPGLPVYLATPIFDDVTFYYQSDTPRFCEYVVTTDFGGEQVISDAGSLDKMSSPTLKPRPKPPPPPPPPPPHPPYPPVVLPPPMPPPQPPPMPPPMPPPSPPSAPPPPPPPPQPPPPPPAPPPPPPPPPPLPPWPPPPPPPAPPPPPMPPPPPPPIPPPCPP